MSKEKFINLKMPYYSKGEEIFSLTTHIVGGGIGVLILLFSIILATLKKDLKTIEGKIKENDERHNNLKFEKYTLEI